MTDCFLSQPTAFHLLRAPVTVCGFSRKGEELVVFMLLSGNEVTGFMSQAEISGHNLVS